MRNRSLAAAFAAALALAASASSVFAQKALVYCPVNIDATGCDRVVAALQSKFADSVDRGFDGTSGTVDLRKIDLQHYSVFVVPSLADDANKQPYALLRSVSSRLRMALNGRVAVYSGAPDQGAANRTDKDAIIQNLARWAANGHTRKSGLVGLVSFLDLSENAADRYSWVRAISLADVSVDDELQTFSDVTPVTPRGGDVLSANGRAVRFSNMASYGLHIGRHAAARTEVSATAGMSSRQSVLVQYSNADGASESVSGGSTGKVGSSGASFSISSSTSASMSTSSSSTSGPTLATDKPDYQPGDTVTFTGTGWMAGDSVTITLHEDPHWTQEDRTVVAVADDGGNFTNHTFVVDERDLNVTFTATAVGSPSGFVAQMTFTDSKPSGVSVGAQSPVSVLSGSNATYTATVAFNGNSSSCTASLSASTTASPAWPAPPAGGFFSFSPTSVTSTGADKTSVVTVKTTGMIPGTYHFTVSADGTSCSGGSVMTSGVVDLVVTAPPTGTTVNPATGTFGGTVNLSAHVEFTAGGSVSGATVNFSLNGTPVGSATTNGGGNATLNNASLGSIAVGTYPTGVSATTVASATAATSTGTNSLTVNPSTQTLTITGSGAGVGTVTSSPAGINCTSTAGTTSGTCSFAFAGGAAVTLTATPSGTLPTAVGSTFAAWTGDGTGTTTRSVTMDAAKAVTAQFKANQTISFTAPSGKTYGDADFDPAATATSALAVTYTSATTSVCTIVSGKVHIVTAGNCTINADQAGDAGNYNAAPQVARSFTIGTKTVTVATLTASDKIYDGTTTATLSGGTLTGVLAADAANVTLNVSGATANFANANVGTAKTITATGLTLAGTAAGNYNLTPATGSATANITAKPVTVATLTASNKVYDGTTAATLTGGTVTGVLAADASNVALNVATATATFADANVGTAKVVSASGLSLSGTAAGNYNLTPATGSTNANITAKAITVATVTAANKVYDGTTTATATGGTLGGVLAGDAANVTLDVSAATATFVTPAVGTAKTVNVSGLGITGTKAPNYSLSGTTGTATADITGKPVTVATLIASNKIYDGTTTATLSGGTLSGVLAVDEASVGLSITGATAHFVDKNVGTGKTVNATGLSLTGAAAGNYALSSTSASTTANISALGVTGTVTTNNKVYDGTTAATGTAPTVVGAISGDAVVLSPGTLSFADKNVGTAKPVAASSWTLTGGDAGNYSLGTVSASAANITALALTGHITADNKVYDGNTNAVVHAVALTGVLGSDAVTLGAGAGAFANKNAGTGKTVTASVTLSGGDATNYSLTSSTATATADITPRALTVGAVGVNKGYDGTTAATVTLTDNRVSGDVFTDAYATASFADKNVGTAKAVSVSGVSISGADAGNYTANTTANTTADITARALAVTATASNKVYDGNANATVTLADNRVAGDVFTSSSSSAAFNNKNVGTGKTVTVGGIAISGVDAGNYAANSTTTTTADITARTLVVTATGVDKVYDGTTSATVTLTDNRIAGDALTPSAVASFGDKHVGTNKPLSVSISLGGADAGNYTANTTAPATASITQRALVVTATAANKVYDRLTTATVTLGDNRVAGDVFTSAYTSATFSDKNVGTGKTVSVTGISLSGADAGDYSFNSTVSTTANITPLAITGSITADNKVYDGNTTATIATRTLVGVISGDNATYSGGTATFADKNVGTGKTVSATGLGLSGGDAGNYTVNATASTTANITPRALLVSATGVNKVYDATTAATVNLTDNRVSGDVFTASSASATFDTKNVGTGKTVTVSGISIAGTDAGNYTFNTSTTTTANITPLALTAHITADNKVYDGTTTATVHAVPLAGVLGTDNVSLTVGAGAFANKNVGTGKTVTAAVSLSGGDAPNYSLTYAAANATADITARALTVGATGVNKIYDGSASATVTLNDNRVAGDAIATAYTSAAFADKNVGTAKPVSVSGVSISGSDAGNYTFNTTASTAADITTRALTVTAMASNKIYDGNTSATVTLADNRVAGDVFISSSTSATFNNKNVGTAKPVTVSGISISGADAANYTFNTTASATADISARPLVVTATGVNKIYDGNANANVTFADNRVSGDAFTESGSATFADKHVGVGKAVSVSGIALSGADANNYSANTTTSTTANIAQRPLVVSATGINKVYDATTTATVNLSDDRVAGDNLTTSYAAAAFNTKSVGTAKPVSVSGISLAGADAGDYSFNATASTTANITPFAITGSITANNKVYDGTTAATIATRTLAGVISGDYVTYTGGTATFADKNVGTGKAVNATGLGLSGGDAGNYTVNATAATTADITARALVVSATGVNRIYDATSTATVTLSDNRVSGDVLTTTYTGATFADKNVGTAKTISVSGISVSGTDAGNYTANTTASTTANISALAITGTITASSRVYNGTNAATIATRVLAGVLGTDVVSYVGGSATFANKHVGTGKVVTATGLGLSGLDAGNYTVNTTATAAADITTLAVTGSIVTNSKIYDGTTTATPASASVVNAISGDAVALTGGTLAFSDKNVGNGKTVTPSGWTLSGTDATDYLLGAVTASVANITPRAVTLTPKATDLTWTGSPQTPSYSFDISPALVSGDVLSGTASFLPATVTNVGTYGITLSGLSNGNYAITFAPGSFKVLDTTSPIGSITQLNPVALNSPATLTVNINDVTTGNSNIVAWKYSIDGVYAPTISVTSGQVPNATLSAGVGSFANTDVKEVCASGQDAGGNWSAPTCGLLAVYDPSAGFVTGGGWIMSPAGAYTANPSLTGKANFGFVSKYQKGANVPTGNTEFQFKEGNLNFSSTSFSWLVIQGTTQAQFKGVGTINGSGNYNFIVTVVDGDNFNGTKKPDTFRIKITDALGNVVYDNQLGADDTAVPTTVISGGSIQIQSK